MADYKRPDGFRFSWGGVNTKDVADALPDGDYSGGKNVRATGSNSIRTRPGYEFIYQCNNNVVTDLRAFTKFNNNFAPVIVARDSTNRVFIDGNVATQLSGNTGNGVSMVPFRPAESSVSWMYIAGVGDYKKFPPPGSNYNFANVGIAEPQAAVEAAPNAPNFQNLGPNNGSWSVSGNNASGISAANRSSGNYLNLLRDPVLSTRLSLQVGSSVYSASETLAINNNTYAVVEDVIPPLGNSGFIPVQAFRYLSGNNGACVLALGQFTIQDGVLANIGGLRRGAIANLYASNNGNNFVEAVFVEQVIVGANGTVAFQTTTVGSYNNLAELQLVPTIIVNANQNNLNGTLLATELTCNLNTGISTFSASFNNNEFARVNNNYVQADDYLHLSVQFSDPTKLVQLLIMFQLDGNNNSNLLYYPVRPNDLTQIQAGQTVLSAMLAAGGAAQIADFSTGISAPAEASAGNNQWSEVLFPVSALRRIGSDLTKTLASCTGMQIQVNVSGNTTFAFSSLWNGAGSQPDIGNNGEPYKYLAVPYSSQTGVRGNPTPLTRYGVSPRHQSVLLKTSNLNTAYDTQIDTLEIYRYGGSITSYRSLGTVASGNDFTDTFSDAAAQAGDPVEIDNTEPWPTIDQPWNLVTGGGNTASAVGPFLVVASAVALPGTMARWLPGTLFQVGSNQDVFTLRSRPSVSGNNAVFEFEECIAPGNQARVAVLEPNVARQALPYVWGPDEHGYVFGSGDPYRPGSISWSKAYAPDAAPSKSSLELSPPSEPQLGGVVLRGVSLAASSNRWWTLTFQPGARQLYTQVEAPVGKRLVAPFGHCTDGKSVFFWADDCIAVTSGGPAESLTDEKLYNLFPHGDVAGVNVTSNGVTYIAPDYSYVSKFRLGYRGGMLYAIYYGANGVGPLMLVYDRSRKAWVADIYIDQMTAVYGVEQPVAPMEGTASRYPGVILASNVGGVWQFKDLINDSNRNNNGGTPISAMIATREFNGGDMRSNSFWGDQYIDVLAPAGMTVTPITQGQPFANNTAIAANNNRQFIPVSLDGGSLQSFVGLRANWTDNFASQTVPTQLFGWQPSYIDKPEVITTRVGDWVDFNGASYVRGVLINADTFAANKNISVRISDNNALVQFSGGAANGQINHNGEQEKPYYFTTPFVAHMVREEPQDAVSWRRFGFQWIKDPWPELSRLASPWMKLGTEAAKYLRGAVIPMDTNGNNVSLNLVSSDGGNNTVGPFNTTAAQKTDRGFAFTTPLIGHEFQIVPSNDVRIWYDEIRWDVDPYPELITETTPWMNLGKAGSKYVRGLVLPIDTGNNNVTFTFTNQAGNNQVFNNVNTTATIQTPYPFAFTTPLVAETMQIKVSAPCRIWWEAARWDCDLWPERIPEASAWFDMGKPGAKYLRGAVIPLDTGGNNVNINFISSDGGNVSLPANTAVNVKTPVAFAFSVPLIGHEFQLVPSVNNSVRIWWEEIEWHFDPWPELTAEASPWMNLGFPGAKYLRGVVIPVDTANGNVSLTLVSSDGGNNNTVGPFVTSTSKKTDVPWAFGIPLIGHEFQLIPANNCRVWYPEIRWDFDPWPELINEATGWLPVLEGGGAAFLQGLVLPIETNGVLPALSLLTDTGATIALVPTVTPPANVKTGVPYSLVTPAVCHQVQLLPTSPCRIWTKEIQWFAQPTPELAKNWITPFTALDVKGYKHIPRIEAAYAATAQVTFTIEAFDGTSPATILLPSTNGVYERKLVNVTLNKGQLYRFSAVSDEACQLFENDFLIWVCEWGRVGPAVPFKLGAAFGDKAHI